MSGPGVSTAELPTRRHGGAARGSAVRPGARWLPALVLCASLGGTAWTGLRAEDPTAPVAALFPPWWSQRDTLEAVAAAGGAVIGAGGLPGLVITRSSSADIAGRLRAAGAWFLLDPRGFGLCSSPRERLP